MSAGPRGEISLKLRYRPPYDWPAMLGFLRARAIAGVESVDGDTYRRTIGLDGQQGTVAVRPADGNALDATVRFPKLSALPQIIARLRRVFDLAADPDAIALQLVKDPTLAPLVAARPGLRVPGAWDGFELAVRAVLGQQITVPGAIRLAGALVARFGETLREPDGALTHVFPEPAALVGADPASMGMPRSRGVALLAVAAAVVADPQIFATGRGLEEAVAQLRSLPGIGEWTAQYIAMRQLREPDAFPAADIGLMRAMADSAGVRPSASSLARKGGNLAAVARLRRPTSVGQRMTEHRFFTEQFATPTGTMLLVTDAQDQARALDWEDHAARMHQLLRLQYGAVRMEPKAGASQRSPGGRGVLWRRVGGDRGPAGDHRGHRVSARGLGSAAADSHWVARRPMAGLRRSLAGRRRCAPSGWPMAPIRSASLCPAIGLSGRTHP